jgi:heme a synthase
MASHPTPGSNYHPGHHRFAVFASAAAFLLLVAGALVTSNDAGLSVPDWPTSFGSMWRMPNMVGGIKFEHSHRMVAEFVGLITIILAVSTWRVDRRSWMRKLGIAAVLGVIFQGVLGGLTVLHFLPPAISTAHALVGQTMFCALVCLALFTSRSWIEEPQRQTEREGVSLRTLTTWLLVTLYIQLLLGAGFRHVWTKWGPDTGNKMPAGEIISYLFVPHALNAIVVTMMALWVITRILMKHSDQPHLTRPALVLLGLLMAQIGLGFLAYVTRLEWQAQAAQLLPSMVAATVAHLAVGAAVLGTAFVLAMQSRRVLLPRTQEQTAEQVAREAVTA